MSKIPTPEISEILKNEFMDPLNLSAYALAKHINVPTSRIQDILHNRREITVDTSVRLGKFFGVSDRYFLNIQNDIDLRNIEIDKHDEYDKIKQYQSWWMVWYPITKNTGSRAFFVSVLIYGGDSMTIQMSSGLLDDAFLACLAKICSLWLIVR